ncbi:MAG: hypothetical protein A2020_05250 [Lentisphaerae bacterium GWF2_45_14]|nr:MAG: hypothetical protein A2020_05250 [Lentisphaerae bacterium GWF2_45_14]
MQILFICTGNTCRSPMCEGYFRSLCEKAGRNDVNVVSAGVMADFNSAPSPNAVRTMERFGIDISGLRSTPLTPELLEKSDIIITMTPSHAQGVETVLASALGRTFNLMQFSSGGPPAVNDPFGGNESDYEQCFYQMKEALDNLFLDMDKFKL